MSEVTGGLGSKRKQIIGIASIVVLLIITILVIKSRGEEIDFKMIMNTMKHADPVFLILAFVCMLLYVHIEGRAIAVIAKPLGYRLKRRHTFVYASADIYFSAITPSATGGQPASAYYMIKDGMKGSDATTTLVLNILMYTASLIILGLWAMAWKFEFLLNCTRIVKLLFVAGLAVQILLLLLCFLCMFSKEIIRNLGGLFAKLLHKLHIIKSKTKMMRGIRDFVNRYDKSMKLLKSNPAMMIKALFMNILQRFAYCTIGYCVYRSLGFNSMSFLDIMAIMLLLMMSVNSIPVPGAVGVSEGSFLSIFRSIYTRVVLVPAMVMTRLISYYVCFIVCGAVTLTYHVSLIRRNYKPVYVKGAVEEKEETPDDEVYQIMQKAQEKLPDQIDELRSKEGRDDKIPVPEKAAGQDNSKPAEMRAGPEEDPAGRYDNSEVIETQTGKQEDPAGKREDRGDIS